MEKVWQQHWRKTLGFNVSKDTDWDSDYECHFGLWEESRSVSLVEQCFSVLPNAEGVLRRLLTIYDKKITTACNKSDEELVVIAESAMADLEVYYPIDTESREVRVIRGGEEKRMEVLGQADPVTISVDDCFSDLLVSKLGDEAAEVYFFLGEPLYQFSSYYEPHNWLLWGLLEEVTDVDPYAHIFELWKMGCQVAIDSESVLVFVDEEF